MVLTVIGPWPSIGNDVIDLVGVCLLPVGLLGQKGDIDQPPPTDRNL
jgi:hypothetical protein